MGADFKLTREQPEGKPNIAILHLSGWLDRDSEQILVDAVQQAKDSGCQYVVLDMAETGTITSAGIRGIQRAYQILTPKNTANKVAYLKLCNAPAQVYQVLGITGLLVNVPMYENAADAVESFEK
jgi:anti-anti-sigma factor